MTTYYTVQKVLSLYGSSTPRATLISAEKTGAIPSASRKDAGSVRVRQWPIENLPKIGERYGFLKALPGPAVVTVFTTKGGVLKTTLALNIARLAALHNIRTCVIGLDLQGDITNALGFEADVDESEEIETALERLNGARGLADVYAGDSTLDEVILATDIPTLDVVPETPELAVLEQDVARDLRREYWLKDNVIALLKSRYDLIILDCSPNWNFLVTNALVACDVLLCPLECKINNFRNLKVFRAFTERFRSTLHLDYEQVFVPTRLTSTRKLSSSIRAWYLANLPGCTSLAIRESTLGEESMAAHVSLPELSPRSIAADEIRELLMEIWSRITDAAARKAAAGVESKAG